MTNLDYIIKRNIKYEYKNGPDKINSWEDAKESGLNCGALIHLLINDLFDIKLPSSLMCFELAYDQNYFRNLSQEEPRTLGDILVLGRVGLSDKIKRIEQEYTTQSKILNVLEHPRLHLVMCTANHNELGEPLVIHATPYQNGGIQLWSIAELQKYSCYQQVYKHLRLKQQQ